MSHHFSVLSRRPHFQPQPATPKARDPILYLLSTPLAHHQRLLLVTIGAMTLRSRACRPSQARLGEILRRKRETVNRHIRALKVQGLVRVVRRGKGLTNVYLLARWVWKALTGKATVYDRNRQYQLDFQRGIEAGLSPPRAILSMLVSQGGP